MWSRLLNLYKWGGPRFKPSTLLLTGFVLHLLNRPESIRYQWFFLCLNIIKKTIPFNA